MATYTPVDGDPFATGAPAAPVVAASPSSSPSLVPVDHDPFAAPMEFDDPITAAAYAKANGLPPPAPSPAPSPTATPPAASGWILPVSWDAAGNPSFDSNA